MEKTLEKQMYATKIKETIWRERKKQLRTEIIFPEVDGVQNRAKRTEVWIQKVHIYVSPGRLKGKFSNNFAVNGIGL